MVELTRSGDWVRFDGRKAGSWTMTNSRGERLILSEGDVWSRISALQLAGWVRARRM
jgi:hypothetical protein